MITRTLKQDVYIRICRDSGYQIEFDRAAAMAANILGCSPLDIWMSLGTDNMMAIASGSHPILQKV